MPDCPDAVDRLARELHAQGVEQTAKARRVYREGFATDEAYRARMREIGQKGLAVRRRKAEERRRREVAERLARRGLLPDAPAEMRASAG